MTLHMTDDQEPLRVPVLMYHSVSAEPTPETRALSVHPDALAVQLELLDGLGCTTVSMDTLVRHWRARARGTATVPLPARPVVLTFDDGYADFHREALPLLLRHRAAASLYVATGWLADAGAQRDGRPLAPMLSWGSLAEVAAEGVEIGGHSHSHPPLDQLGGRRLRDELMRNQDLLEARLQRRVTTFAHPFGHSDARVRSAVRACGYRGACAVANAMAEPRQGPFALSRLTVRRSTTPGDFLALVQGQELLRIYGRDRALTRGYALVRAGRRSLGRAGRLARSGPLGRGE